MRSMRILAAVAGAALVAFHAALLAGQIVRGQLTDPKVFLRWVIAAGLAASLVALKRRGLGMCGRNAAALWVMAALLHGPAVAGDSGYAASHPAVAETTVTLSLQLVALSASLLLTSSLLAARAVRPRRHGLRSLAFGFNLSSATAGGFSPPFAPRPPPRP